MKIAFIGGGMMAEAIISGLIRQGSAKPEEITASDINPNQLKLLTERHGIRGISENHQAIEGKDIVVLSVKPQVLPEVTDGLRGQMQPGQLVISVMAGVKIETIIRQLEHDCIVRVMPNTPAQIGEGISVWTSTKSVTSEQKDLARTTLAAMGKDIFVAEEKYIDMATAVSGSGPAYMFLIVEALTDAAVHIGMPRHMAGELVLQTMLGSARIAEVSGKHPAELRNAVTSPGGTTAAGLSRLEEGGLRAILAQAVVAAYDRARELGKE